MKIYLIGDTTIDVKSIADVLTKKTLNEIICTSDDAAMDKHADRLTVFLYSSANITEERLKALDQKHDIQIDAGTMDAESVSEIIANMVV